MKLLTELLHQQTDLSQKGKGSQRRNNAELRENMESWYELLFLAFCPLCIVCVGCCSKSPGLGLGEIKPHTLFLVMILLLKIYFSFHSHVFLQIPFGIMDLFFLLCICLRSKPSFVYQCIVENLFFFKLLLLFITISGFAI